MQQIQSNQTQFSENLQQFIQKLHQTLPENANIFYSPINIQTALAMTYAGAQEQTQSEMKQALFPTFLSDDHLHTEFLKSSQILSAQNSVELYQANKIWPSTGENLLPEYISVLEKNYNSTLKPLNYSGAPEECRQEINKWVEEQTKDKIKELLSKNDIDKSTSLVLTSAIYFKGNWKNQFKEKLTVQQDFQISKNQKAQVQMMKQSETFPYFEDSKNKFSVLEMPYEGEYFSMGFLLPKENKHMEKMKKYLFTEKDSFKIVFSKLSDEKVSIGVPKFKFEFKTSLNDSLKKIGVNNAFGPQADFSGMNGCKGLFISDVIHQAVIEVNEKGAEAAAVTVVKMTKCAVKVKKISFELDRPFLFYIKEKSSNSILFFGEYTNPN